MEEAKAMSAARMRLQEIFERRFWDEDGEAEMLREFLYDNNVVDSIIIRRGNAKLIDVWDVDGGNAVIDVRALEDAVSRFAAAQKLLDGWADAAGMRDGLRVKHQELL